MKKEFKVMIDLVDCKVGKTVLPPMWSYKLLMPAQKNKKLLHVTNKVFLWQSSITGSDIWAINIINTLMSVQLMEAIIRLL